jgi:hypothetical protein
MRHKQAMQIVWQMARWYRDGKKLVAAPPDAEARMDKALVAVTDLISEVSSAEQNDFTKTVLAVDVMREACPNMYPYIEMSTSMIKESTSQWLTSIEQMSNNERVQAHSPILISNTYGWFVYIVHEPEPGSEDHWPEEFRALVQYARERKCVWMNIDQDADPLADESFETYDW